ncbi:ABC transporter ATP-binding protein [Paenibacillus turpanensis]|uniref:ABC transporter ATP-binding protein n=1 Tax=Paenibacillus turpanensis TaxID=2689078 RepID=UPI00140BC6AA|nr:ABC transporter ATP-binding protein [Paenibacillus turpanensis]
MSGRNVEAAGLPLLSIEDLSISFNQYRGWFRQEKVQPIHGLHLQLRAGEVVAVVGSSGSGKSLLAHAILGILPGNAEVRGSMRFDGRELSPELQAKLRGRQLALVPQSVNYLDPLMQVGKQVQAAVKGGDAVRKQREAFRRYGLAEQVDRLLPFQLSGGMARRVLVSTAAVSGARVIIADEPTPGLDEASLDEALASLRELADEGAAVMLITHDIASALRIADRVAVFYAGTTVEVAPAEDFAGDGGALRHPYSRALWRALPQNGFAPAPGAQPQPGAMPAGCLYAPRCELAAPPCAQARPEPRELRGGMVRCFADA